MMRCWECGAWSDEQCLGDEHARDLLRWTQEHSWAQNYLERAGHQPIDDWHEDPERAARYWPGCAYESLAFVWQCLERWGVEITPDLEAGRAIVTRLGFNSLFEERPR